MGIQTITNNLAGNSISSYLFVLATEGILCLLKSNESSNMHGLQVAYFTPPVNHLLFVDDDLMFFKANGAGAKGMANG